MANSIYIHSASVSKLKKLAKLFARENNITHSEALNLVARNAGFEQWHQVSIAAKSTEKALKSLSQGLFALFDVKEADDLDYQQFQPSSDFFVLRIEELLQWLEKL